MGEDQVYPDAPKERMAAKVPGGQGGAGGPRAGGAATGAVPPEAASEVAEHERGPQFQAAFGEGRKQMSEGRQKKDTDFRTSQEKHRQKVDAEVASNTAGQAAERDRAMADVTAQRAGWRAEQDEELGKLGDKKTERHEKVRKDVQDKEKQTDDDVAKEKDDGDRKIRDENTRAERDAEKKRDDSVEDSGNWVTKAFDWIKKKVIEIKDAIVRVIKAARDAVVGFIKNFKETVERWIDAARKFVVDTIKQLVDDLVEFAKAMVRAIVELAARVRKFVTDLIAAAIALVNRLADALKQAVSDLLDAIGKLLSSILDFLKKMLQAAVKAVVDAVKAVLDFASKLLSALGDWMLIAVDFLSDPGGWLGGAKNSAVDGAKNHLFAEVSSAVKQWFREKIQEIIGVPKAVIDKLVRGGWTLDKIVKEAWDAVVPQLPLIIGELVMTKVVAKLIPGAGWVMAVIDAIRTAWGALSAILRALGMVLDWLKAVRGGGAGILFAKAVAAGVVALLEVLYQALLSGIGKYVSKVGRRLKDVAAKLGKPKPGKPKGPGAPDAPADGRPAKPEDRAPGKSATPDRPTDTKRPAPPKSPAPPKKPADRPKPLSPPAPTRPKDSARPDRPKETSRPQDTATPKPRTTDPSRPRDTDRPDRPGDRTPDRDPKRRDDTSPDKRSPDREDSGRRPRPKDDKGKVRDRHKDDKSRDRRPKDTRDKDRDRAEAKQRKKEQRTEEENSQESKKDRLHRAVLRIRPKVRTLLDKGVGQSTMRGVLLGLRAWHRLTGLSAEPTRPFSIVASLNPEEGVTDQQRVRAELEAHLDGLSNRKELEEAMGVTSVDDWFLFMDGGDVNEFGQKMKRRISVLAREEAKKRNDWTLRIIRRAEKEVKSGATDIESGGTGTVSQNPEVAKNIQRMLEYSGYQEQKSRVKSNSTTSSSATKWETHFDRLGYARKALILKRAEQKGELILREVGKGKSFPNPLPPEQVQEMLRTPRIKNITDGFKQAVRVRALELIAGRPELQDRINRKITSMHPDHEVDLKFGGLDSWKNLYLLDGKTNTEMGPAISINNKGASAGTVVTVTVKWWDE